MNYGILFDQKDFDEEKIKEYCIKSEIEDYQTFFKNEKNVFRNDEQQMLAENNIIFEKIRKSVENNSKLNEINLRYEESNIPIDFIHSYANIRASIYKIEKRDRKETRFVALKITPTIINTSSIISGMVTLEIIKIVQLKKDERVKENLCDSFFNLSTPYFQSVEPKIVSKKKIVEAQNFTIWDRYLISEPMSLSQLIDHFERNIGLKLEMISFNTFLIYAYFRTRNKMEMEISAIVKDLNKQPFPEWQEYIYLEVAVNQIGNEDEEIDFPAIKYKIPK